MSPTQRSLAWLRLRGYTAQVVEKWNPHAKIRQDLFGCIDVVACFPGVLVGVQACAGSSVSARLKKALAEPRLVDWLRAGGAFVVHGWRKVGAKGKRKQWDVRSVWVRLDRNTNTMQASEDEQCSK
jgi:regulator of sigma D